MFPRLLSMLKEDDGGFREQLDSFREGELPSLMQVKAARTIFKEVARIALESLDLPKDKRGAVKETVRRGVCYPHMYDRLEGGSPLDVLDVDEFNDTRISDVEEYNSVKARDLERVNPPRRISSPDELTSDVLIKATRFNHILISQIIGKENTVKFTKRFTEGINELPPGSLSV